MKDIFTKESLGHGLVTVLAVTVALIAYDKFVGPAVGTRGKAIAPPAPAPAPAPSEG